MTRPLATSLLLSLLIVHSLCASAQRQMSIAYYDVDRLYDTIPALFYNDTDFTPDGRLHWTSERYERKIRNIAAVIDSMQMNLVAVAGVETEEVVRDLASACHEPYCYLHRTLNGFDGLDIALLYHGDRFYPTATDEGRGWIYVEGEVDGTPIGILICRNARYATEAVTDCRATHPHVPLIAAGRFTTQHAHKLGFNDAHARAERAGRGTIRYRDGWRMRERILIDTALHTYGADVYARHWLMRRDGTAPQPTYERTAYRGGYSRTLPAFAYFVF
ncbi:MAG: hypothetical protein RR522_05605 [Alistipes sp.]